MLLFTSSFSSLVVASGLEIASLTPFIIIGTILLFCLALFMIFRHLIRSSMQVPPMSFAERDEHLKQRRAEIIQQLQGYSRFEELTRHIEKGNKDEAVRIVRESGQVEWGEVEAVVTQLEKDVRNSHASAMQALYENPDAVRILLRSNNKAEAIELYHDRTGVSWQEAKETVDRMER